MFEKQIKRLACDLDLLESVKFLGPRHDVVELLQQAWGFVLPSRWEGMPNALVEAMACSLPCVATRVSGSEDLIADGVNGLLVPPEQPTDMARALQRIIEEPTFAQRLAEQARATVVRDYQISAIVERCLDLYEQMYARYKQKPPARGEGGKA
jgi:glycosyltransferase involved in cell wall biosynthesis